MLIKLYDLVPQVYSNASRDFQYLSWLINIVLNSVKHNVDDLYNLPNNHADPRLAELLALTLGFKVKRNYDQNQLVALVSIIPGILRNKGTEKAVEMTGRALLKAAGVAGEFKVVSTTNNELEVLFPRELTDMSLFIDLLPYILPAGMTCRIVRKTAFEQGYNTKLGYSDELRFAVQDDTDIANMRDIDKSENIIFANLAPTTEGTYTLNTGLLDNVVIPTFGDKKEIPINIVPEITNTEDSNTAFDEEENNE